MSDIAVWSKEKSVLDAGSIPARSTIRRLMNSTIIWVLSFTVLGAVSEHKEFAKYKTKQECEQALTAAKEEYKDKKQKISGACKPVLK